MRNKVKRTLSSILAFIMVVSTVAVLNVSSVFADSVSSSKDWDLYSTFSGSTMPTAAGSSVTVNDLTYYGTSNSVTSSSKTFTLTDQSTKTYTGYVRFGGSSTFKSGSDLNRVITFTPAVAGTVSIYYVPSGDSERSLLISQTISSTNRDTTTAVSGGSVTQKNTDPAVLEDVAVEASKQVYIWCTGDYYIYGITFTPSATVAITGLTVSPSTATINAYGTTQLTATATPTGASNSVTWASSDDEVAIVSSTGLVTGVAAGTATITATSTENATISASATITVNAITPVTEITISGTNTLYACGGTTQLSAEVTPANATYTDVNWTSDTVNVATVDSTGLVTGVGVGTATITATAQDGTGVTAEYTVTVSNESAASEITGAITIDLTDYDTLKLTSSADNEKITEGTVFGTYLTAEGDNLTKRTTTTYGILTGVTETGMIKFTTSTALSLTVVFSSTSGSNSSDIVVLDSSKNVVGQVASVTGTSNDELTISSLSAGTYYIGSPTESHGGTNLSRGARVKSLVFEEAAATTPTLTVSTTDLSLEEGEEGTISYTIENNDGDCVASFASSDETVATVAADGTVTAIGEGSATITVTLKDSSGETTHGTATVSVTVTAAGGGTGTAQIITTNEYLSFNDLTDGDVYSDGDTINDYFTVYNTGNSTGPTVDDNSSAIPCEGFGTLIKYNKRLVMNGSKRNIAFTTSDDALLQIVFASTNSKGVTCYVSTTASDTDDYVASYPTTDDEAHIFTCPLTGADEYFIHFGANAAILSINVTVGATLTNQGTYAGAYVNPNTGDAYILSVVDAATVAGTAETLYVYGNKSQNPSALDSTGTVYEYVVTNDLYVFDAEDINGSSTDYIYGVRISDATSGAGDIIAAQASYETE